MRKEAPSEKYLCTCTVTRDLTPAHHAGDSGRGAYHTRYSRQTPQNPLIGQPLTLREAPWSKHAHNKSALMISLSNLVPPRSDLTQTFIVPIITFFFDLNWYEVLLPPATFWTRPWSQVSSLLPPPGTCLHFYHAQGSAILPFSSFKLTEFIELYSPALGFFNSSILRKKTPYEHECALGET